jgi:hypothetical protein
MASKRLELVQMAKCWTCGSEHEGQKCFLVKALEYYPNGNLKRIEYLTPADLRQDQQPTLENVVPFGTRQ